ncbi:hypothetical protein Vadar_018780 [Vaccinium darrowii]|uniref:Uncharacterized protein n=1 Tax=Vaccinium darrowii TaxID=229202 RepID=A0ACB7X2K2_9ERIC|nr:hypothetical protein Vadar_018780 [Vaccinium darrowii]
MSNVENHPSQWSMYLLPRHKETSSPIQELDLSFTSPHLNKEFTHQGTCNGIMCLSLNSKIVICNPATREYGLLPQPPYITRLWRTNYLGFAFDSKTNDYQVIRVDTLREFTRVYYKIHLYSMSADLWEEIIINTLNHDFTGYHRHPCTSLNGVFYWLNSYDYVTNVRTIDALNTIEGSFERRSLPVGIGSELPNKLCLLKDCLALVGPTSNYDDFDYLLGKYRVGEKQLKTQFDVWLMEKCGGRECWTKKYTIGRHLGNIDPFGFRPNSEVLMTGCDDGLIVSYNFSTRDIKEYRQLCNFPELRCLTQVFEYSESLVSVKRRVDLALPGWLIYTLRNMMGKGKAKGYQSTSRSSS